MSDAAPYAFLADLERIIQDRRANPTEASYTALLFQKGINRIAQKVGEEAVEVVIASKDNDAENLKDEAADLLYHLLVLLAYKNMKLADIVAVLEARHQ